MPSTRVEGTERKEGLSRRTLLAGAAGASAAAAGALGLPASAGESETVEKAVTKGRLKQSVAQWCFNDHWDIEDTCRIASKLGLKSVELVDTKHWPLLKEHGLVCALHGSHPLKKGMNDPDNHEMCIEKIRQSIDECAEYGFPNVIAFTGNRNGIPDEEGLENCVKGLKKVVGYAEDKGVNLCLEILNSREDHPGYQGDHVDYCMDIIKGVGSPRMKLLFDIYHAQIMDGDIIRRIREYQDYIGHYHTAGNPGRHELDDSQEINYGAVMKAIADTGYDGYVGQEFIPTRDPVRSLRHAAALCDV